MYSIFFILSETGNQLKF